MRKNIASALVPNGPFTCVQNNQSTRLNILIENLVDIIPFFGNLFDFIWKANSKNMILVENYHANPTRVRRNSKFVLAFTVAFIMTMVVATIALSIFVLRALILWLDPSGPGA